MTAQTAEILLYKGKEQVMFTTPLSDYLQFQRPDIRFQFLSTALYRGYVGHWEISDGRLFLTRLNGKLEDGTDVSVATIFPESLEKVFANWYTGTLHVAQGALIEISNFHSTYERDVFLGIEDGMQKSTWTRYNGKASPGGPFYRSALTSFLDPGEDSGRRREDGPNSTLEQEIRQILLRKQMGDPTPIIDMIAASGQLDVRDWDNAARVLYEAGETYDAALCELKTGDPGSAVSSLWNANDERDGFLASEAERIATETGDWYAVAHIRRELGRPILEVLSAIQRILEVDGKVKAYGDFGWHIAPIPTSSGELEIKKWLDLAKAYKIFGDRQRAYEAWCKSLEEDSGNKADDH